MMDKIDNVMIKGAKNLAAIGVKGNANRINPYAPSLINNPASITDPATGASTCAKGNQI